MARSLHKPTEEDRKVLALLDGKVGEDVLHANHSNVVAKVASLDAEEKAALLAVCVSALTGPQTIRNEAVRVAAVRAIVALLPSSLGAIADLLNRFQDRNNYEVHFTLFCYLDAAQDMPDASSLTKDVLLLVENYLMTVPSKTALAAWMAGDMLGEHWDEREAVPLLMKTAQGGKYWVGRKHSVFGLAHILDRVPVESDAHKGIVETLRRVSSADPSKFVRESAKEEVRDWREPSSN